MILTYIRHAQSMGNTSGDYSTLVHDTLSPMGLEQAEQLAMVLGGQQFDEILASPLKRALQTARPWLASSGLQARVDPLLAEACWQEHEEPPSASARLSAPSVMPPEHAPHFTWHPDRPLLIPPEDETFGEGMRRVLDFAETLRADAATEKHLVVFGHGHFGSYLLCALLDCSVGTSFHMDNCGITSLSIRPARVRLLFHNRLSLT